MHFLEMFWIKKLFPISHRKISFVALKGKKKKQNKPQSMSENKYVCCALEPLPSQQAQHLPGTDTNHTQASVELS